MGKETTERAPQVHELFIEELAEVQGGGPDELEELKQKIREQLLTTTGLCEEGPVC